MSVTVRNNLPCSQLALDAEQTLNYASACWLSGVPRYEVAFLNQLTGTLQLSDCRPHPAFQERLRVKKELCILHAAGRETGDDASKDAYGADLAVRVRLPPLQAGQPGRLKVALIQLKVRRNENNIKVTKHQIATATAHTSRIKEWSWVAAVDHQDGRVWLRSVTDIDRELSCKQQASYNSPVECWTESLFWLYSWLSCETGPYTLESDDFSNEKALDRLLLEASSAEPNWGRIHELRLLFEEWRLPRVYVRVDVTNPQIEGNDPEFLT